MIPENLRGRADLLLDRFSAYYDVSRCDEGDLFARAEFHSRGEKYLLSRSVNLWSVEDNEYVFFFVGDRLTPERLESAKQLSIEEGMSRIKPTTEHRSSMLTAVLIYDSIDAQSQKDLRTIKYHRDFGFMLRGWVDYRIAALEASTSEVVANRRGRDIAKVLGAVADSPGDAK